MWSQFPVSWKHTFWFEWFLISITIQAVTANNMIDHKLNRSLHYLLQLSCSSDILIGIDSAIYHKPDIYESSLPAHHNNIWLKHIDGRIWAIHIRQYPITSWKKKLPYYSFIQPWRKWAAGIVRAGLRVIPGLTDVTNRQNYYFNVTRV